MGAQLPIVLGIIEYGILLAIKRYPLQWMKEYAKNIIKVSSATKSETEDQKAVDFVQLAKTIDQFTLTFSLVFIVIFNCIFWSTALL